MHEHGLLRYARNDVNRLLLASALILLGGCDVMMQPARLIPEWTTDWRRVATDDDRARLRDWRSAFVSALQAARTNGHAAEIAREGALLEPDAGLGGGPIPNGTYRCRVIKLGAKSPGMLDYVSYPPFTCHPPERDLQGSRQAQRVAALCRADLSWRRGAVGVPGCAGAGRRGPRAAI